MALPILDGNQTSTTLATTVSGGAHYPNHIIASGTVTASVENGTILSVESIRDGDGNTFGLDRTFPISGTVTANVLYAGNNGESAPNQVALIGVNNDGTLEAVGREGVNYTSLPIYGTVTANVANSITVGALPVQLSSTTIGGTARLNVTLSSATTVGATAPSYANLYGGSDGTNIRAISVDSSGRTVVTGTTSILGTPSVTMGAISGTVTASVSSTTVTVSALPSGALTTRFGSVTTANTAQLTAAVTNSARRYLLCQNLDPSVTVTIGIGFTPTTTQGIQLAAGGGIIMDSFVSTGAVWWLSSSAGSNFSILEG